MFDQLEGIWCEQPRSDGSELCLIAGGGFYRWASWDCQEAGQLSGGLEFTPAQGNCISGMYYSASVDWTRTGIEVYLDSGKVIKLDYQP